MSLREGEPIPEAKARLINPMQLAFIGDTVWDLLVRNRLITCGHSVRSMHKDAVACVNAHAQSMAFRRIEGCLTEVELEVFKRGRNAHSHHGVPRNQDVADYRAATGLEALVGFLYLTGQDDRLLQLFSISQEVSECHVQK